MLSLPAAGEPSPGERTHAGVIAALDLGTNSFHLVVARHHGGRRFEVITREKETIRLGHGATDMKHLAPEAIDRAVASIARMAKIARSHDARHMRAVATSATREAANAEEFLARVHAETGVEIDVISGVEEARLIYLGILQAVPVYEQRCLLIDIGGGSTELLIGERAETLAARSFKLGAVRLTDRFFPGGIVNDGAIAACTDHIRSVLVHFDAEVAEYGCTTVVASSGTAETLARMVQAHRGEPPLRTYNLMEFTRAELADVVHSICAAPDPATRARLAGLESSRADIAVAGALILDQIAERYELDTIMFSEAALREGVLVETARQLIGVDSEHPETHDVARRSVHHLRDRCDEDPAHSDQVTRLALCVFDQLTSLEVITPDPHDRDLLEFGALLANVGLVVAHSKHHLHSHYVIRNSELAGLTDHEIDLIAQIARYHRKSHPKPTHPEFAALRRADQQRVRLLAGILRIAIGLDRSHRGHVESLDMRLGGGGILEMSVRPVSTTTGSGHDLGLEIYAASERRHLLVDALGCEITIRAVT